MKLGTMVALDANVEQSIFNLKKYDFNTCQLCCWDMQAYTDENAEKIKKAVAAANVEITAAWCGWVTPPCVWDFIDGPNTIGIVPEAYRALRIENLKNGAAFAEKLGVDKIATHMGFLPENCNTDEFRAIVAAIKDLADYCDKKGITLLFETGQETPVTLMRTIKAVGLDNLGINLDPANLILYGKGNPCDAVGIFGKYIKGIHAKDGNYPTDFSKLGEEKRIGDGQVNFPLLVKKLKEVGYDGAITIEREISGEQQTKDILYAKKYLENLLYEKN